MKYFITALLILIGFGSYAQHTLILKNGQKINGDVQSLKDYVVTILVNGSATTYKVAEIKEILFEADNTGGSTPSGMKGVSYVMPGRKMIKQPKVDNLTTEKGIVVVEITLNKYGNVIKAQPGAEGTTTTSQYLLTKAQQAAESTKFDTNPTMPLEQKGTITITF